MIEVDSLKIPVGMIRPGDCFYVKGQCHAVERVEPLTQYLVRVHTNVMSFKTELILDARLVLEAVMRVVPTTNTEEDK